MKSITQLIKEKPYIGWLLFFATVILVFLLGLLASSIIERRAEAIYAYKPTKEISQWEPRNNVWGENFQREYETYLKTSDTSFRSMYNGNAQIDALELDPKLVVLWAGYPFSKDYSQPRGHFYAIDDIRNTLRTEAPMNSKAGKMPNTCWTCKSPDVPRMMNKEGISMFYKGNWASKGHEIVNFIGCADCHDAKTMNLRISRPALIEAFERQGKDITKATQQEMRSLVCAQCHVEYYFKGDDKYLTFPWDKSTDVDSVESYYDSYDFSDWKHSLSRTPMLKAQHPDFEIFKMGIHGQRGVSCADCHMPYRSEGGVKFTDHHIQSPLNNIANTCQVCHRESEETLKNNVYERQQKVYFIRDRAEEFLVRAHVEAKAAWDAGATEIEMKPVLTLIRHSQWRWDYAAAGHGNAFHAPLETMRMLGTSMEKSQEARLILSRILAAHGVKKPIDYPDISTKAKAQKYIGLDMDKLIKEKQEFKNKIIPEWEKKAKERENKYSIKNL
jgi:nitrite reductase (cytochrome c-552)